MNVNPDVNFEELARSTDDFNGAQLKAVCVEAGMLALRRDATEVTYFASFDYHTCYECGSTIVLEIMAHSSKWRIVSIV
jgi:ATP-dependent 26S proteasome regulatory subunit